MLCVSRGCALLSVCAFVFVARSAEAPKEVSPDAVNHFPNPSFEEWKDGAEWPEGHGGKWRVASAKDEFGKPLFAYIGPTNGLAHTGRTSLYVNDNHGGQYNNVILCSLPHETVKAFAGKGLRLSAWVFLLGRNTLSEVGIGVGATSRESAKVYAKADFAQDVTRTDGFVKLCCYLKVPQDVQSLTVMFRCANGFYGRCEVCYDDVELNVIPLELVPESEEARAKRLRKPFVPNHDAMKWAANWTNDMVFTSDGFKRPAIKGGNFVWDDGSYFFPVGPWIHPHSDRDWNEKAIARHGINHPAYTFPPGKRAFESVGCNAAQISGAPAEIGAATAGYVKDLSRVTAAVQKCRELWKEFQDTYLSVDFAFGYNYLLKSMNPELDERICQKKNGWCSFVPFCPECPEGKEYYRNYFSTGVKFSLDCGLNVGFWELFNESVYGCECRYNKKAFAEESEKRYGTIESANAAWGTAFKDFDAVSRVSDMGRFKGLWNEWCEFLACRYPKVLEEFCKAIKEIDRRQNVYFTEQLWFNQIWDGMTDYRRISDALDLLSIEGGWNYGGELKKKAKDEMEAIVFAGSAHWYVVDFFNALARGRKPVINNELYCSRIVDGKRAPSRAIDLVTSLWMEFFHGISGSHMYIWEKRANEWTTFEQAKANVISPSYKSHALLNPYNWPVDQLGAFSQFCNELAKYQSRISEFPRVVKPSIGIFHSQVSSAMARYGRAVKMPLVRAHSSLLHDFYPVTFVFDDEIVGGKLPDGMKVIVVPAADFERESVRIALEQFVERGGYVVADERAFSFDEHGRKTGKGVASALKYDAEKMTGTDLLAVIRQLKIRKTAELVPVDGKGAIGGADVQVIDRGDFKLALLVNMVAADEPRTVRFSLSDASTFSYRVLDGVTGKVLADRLGTGIEIVLPPQERVLLELSK